jgi:hypothetical protein
MKLQAIKDLDGFKKDEKSGAVLAVDNNALNSYKNKREKNTRAQIDIDNIKEQHLIVSNDINNIKNDLIEIKKLFNQFLLQKGN